MTPVIAAIGTTHPLNIAGLGLDLRVGARLGVRVVCVVAGISAQDARGVLARMPVDPQTIAAQFAALHDANVAAVHVGALLDAASVRAVADGVARVRAPVVCDPVLAATGGDRLADDATIAALRSALFPRALLVTPNLDEASVLLGAPVRDLAAMEAAAHALRATGAQAVLIKGGHLAGDAVDVLAFADRVVHFREPRIAASLRGTGDLLAAAIAARLALGDELVAAVGAARAFVRACLYDGVDFAGTRTLP